MHQPDLINTAQAAAILGESRWTTRRRIAAGQLPVVAHMGGTNPYLLDRAEVERFAAERAAEAES